MIELLIFVERKECFRSRHVTNGKCRLCYPSRAVTHVFFAFPRLATYLTSLVKFYKDTPKFQDVTQIIMRIYKNFYVNAKQDNLYHLCKCQSAQIRYSTQVHRRSIFAISSLRWLNSNMTAKHCISPGNIICPIRRNHLTEIARQCGGNMPFGRR